MLAERSMSESRPGTGSIARTWVDALGLEALAQGTKLPIVILVRLSTPFHQLNGEDFNDEKSEI